MEIILIFNTKQKWDVCIFIIIENMIVIQDNLSCAHVILQFIDKVIKKDNKIFIPLSRYFEINFI